MIRNALLLAAMAAFLVGCAETVITNLTPSQYKRNETGVYAVEVELTSSQQTLQHHSIDASIIVGTNSYPMRRTLKTNYRWEGTLPVPRTQGSITYHFKFDYGFNRFGVAGRDSKLSPSYELKVVEQ